MELSGRKRVGFNTAETKIYGFLLLPYLFIPASTVINMVRDVYKRIRLLEREIEKVKVLHACGKIATTDAKKAILHFDRHIMKNLSQIPAHEKELYMIKKEFGKVVILPERY